MPESITKTSEGLKVPNEPIIPYIEGDGTGPDIWAAASRVLDSAVEFAYGLSRRLNWHEVLAGEKAFNAVGSWMPEETLKAFQDHLIGIKGPLTTPTGEGIRSLNVALRQTLDLYACVRPVRWFKGVPSPLKEPYKTDMVIFRENTEDIYAGIEFEHGTDDNARFLALLKEHFPTRYEKIRFPDSTGIGVKPISREGTRRLVIAAMRYAIERGRKSLTIVHKGNIMKFTEGAFMRWAYETVAEEFGAQPLDGGPWHRIPEGKPGAGIVIKDVIADAFLQQILLRPAEYDVVVTMNLNGDYISDALAACVGGIGIAPGANINYNTGHAIFEATHGTAPKYTGQDKVNPGSVILSGVMMLEHLGWTEAADLVVKGLEGAIDAKTVTYDFERLMEGATLRKCSEFASDIVKHMG